MKLILKYLAKDILSCLAVIGVLFLLHVEPFKVTAIVVAVGFVIQFILSVILAVKPIVSLYYSLHNIDFSSIDVSFISFHYRINFIGHNPLFNPHLCCFFIRVFLCAYTVKKEKDAEFYFCTHGGSYAVLLLFAGQCLQFIYTLHLL